jgi:hypothetical protein
METLDHSFFIYLRDQLAFAIGPIAQVVIDDVVEDLGYDCIYFPRNEVGTLIDWIAREIPYRDKKRAFESVMAEKITNGEIVTPLPHG